MNNPGGFRQRRTMTGIFAAAFLLVVLALLGSIAVGVSAITFADVWLAVRGEADPQTTAIIVQLRLPRTLVAAGVGALLAVSGGIAQGLFRNPLADPSLIGVSAGAAAGASAVIVLFSGGLSGYLGLSMVSVGALGGAVLAVSLVYRLATSATGTSVATMLLAGIAINFFAGSIANLFEFFADHTMLRRMSLWRMGGLDTANYPQVVILTILLIAVAVLLPRYTAALNALLLGESEARHLGIDVDCVKKRLIMIVAASVGVAVAMVGPIAFVGLVVPHMVRMVVGSDHRYLLPLSAIGGALLLVLADTLARIVMAPTEIPVGLVTALIGAPVFIALLRHRYEYGGRL